MKVGIEYVDSKSRVPYEPTASDKAKKLAEQRKYILDKQKLVYVAGKDNQKGFWTNRPKKYQ